MMDSKDNKKDDDGLPKLTQPEMSTKFGDDEEQTGVISQNRYATTQSVAESLIRVRSELGQGQGGQKSSITLNILGIDTPITFHDKTQITLGRKNPATNEHPDVDLSGLPLNTAGISRKHVNLVFTNGQWYVEDLGSRNGTWLNSKLLMAYQRYKLHDGDQLRTGGISIIVLTQAEETSKDEGGTVALKTPLPDRLVLTTSSIVENQLGLETSYMTHHLMPYLQAVIEIIQYVDRAKKRPQREISIVSMEFNYPTITVRFTYPHEMLKFMTGQSLVARMSESRGQLTIGSSAEDAVAVADQSIVLARQFAEEYFPLIASDQSIYYQQLLAPLLKVCLESDIRVAM